MCRFGRLCFLYEMPLQSIVPLPSGCLGVWKIDEREEDLRSIAGDTLCRDVRDDVSLKRRLEKLAVRALLTSMLRYMRLENCGGIIYHDDGSPYMDNGPFVSISHTDGYAAVILSRDNEVGIDIEVRSSRALKLVTRFESEGEFYTNSDSATLCWSAKESVFKRLGGKVSDFRGTMHIPPFLPLESGSLSVGLSYDGADDCCNVNYRVGDGFVLTWIC